MKSRKFADSIKNAMGTVMLLAGAFFVCSTLLSIRSVMADPIAPVDSTVQMLSQSGRNGVNPRSGRASPRNRANATSRATVARTAVVYLLYVLASTIGGCSGKGRGCNSSQARQHTCSSGTFQKCSSRNFSVHYSQSS